MSTLEAGKVDPHLWRAVCITAAVGVTPGLQVTGTRCRILVRKNEKCQNMYILSLKNMGKNFAGQEGTSHMSL